MPSNLFSEASAIFITPTASTSNNKEITATCPTFIKTPPVLFFWSFHKYSRMIGFINVLIIF
jgi:hypothetical protein